ncbi:ABC transporter ATP-binding protein [Corynebacterium yudongzhengii]|uniref:ABC transporter ATP-binding protein n=1 Tax=Corynebacterium yudongzhengii TaxID=2080740 RepID=A0A2U1T445_9CORY|nr:ATP-binding cassette domain-containing protein [Corynebacterium yudongzhengii]AWB82889.1 ABC transporter ATP-binding protein [Corynebacterium yudongzhengii]PWC00786.1 ABC transporter ATP-binding protein [Corynebacterium yudongzhengii]
MTALIFDHISFSYADRRVISDLSLRIHPGERAVLVGPNGSGKTTLLQLAAGQLLPEAGAIHAPDSAQVLPVESFDGTVQEYLDASLHSLTVLEDRLTTGEDYEQVLDEMIARDVWSLPTRREKTLAGLGLSMPHTRPLATLSPGQRARLQLAVTLLLRPHLLLFDEPTNHLDTAAVDFLVTTLRSWPGPVLMASHDRAFIEAAANVIYDLELAPWQALATAAGEDGPPGVHRCDGNYSDYLLERTHAMASHEELHAQQQELKQSLHDHREATKSIAAGGSRLAKVQDKREKFMLLQRAAGTAARRNRDDERKLADLAAHEVRKPRYYHLEFPTQAAQSSFSLSLSARKARVAQRLQPVTFDLGAGEHLLVTGDNGSGKSTLLSWIATGTPPAGADGSLTTEDHVALVPQRMPEPGDFPEDVWEDGIGEAGRGLLHPSMWARPIPKLSAGNQRRAQFAVALHTQPHLLVIDEPTNYLDLATIEALETALKQWEGSLVIASHDRWLIEHWEGKRLHLDALAR